MKTSTQKKAEKPIVIKVVHTQHLDKDDRISSYSKTTYNKGKEPVCDSIYKVHGTVLDVLQRHFKDNQEGEVKTVTTVSTSQGKFVFNQGGGVLKPPLIKR